VPGCNRSATRPGGSDRRASPFSRGRGLEHRKADAREQLLEPDVANRRGLEQAVQQAIAHDRRKALAAEQLLCRHLNPGGGDETFPEGAVLPDQAGGNRRQFTGAAPRLGQRAQHDGAKIIGVRKHRQAADALHEQALDFRRLCACPRLNKVRARLP
jgi:hypothetical protein